MLAAMATFPVLVSSRITKPGDRQDTRGDVPSLDAPIGAPVDERSEEDRQRDDPGAEGGPGLNADALLNFRRERNEHRQRPENQVTLFGCTTPRSVATR